MKISKSELERLYRTMTVQQAAIILGVSRQTFYAYLKKAGIELTKNGNRNPSNQFKNKIEIVD